MKNNLEKSVIFTEECCGQPNPKPRPRPTTTVRRPRP